MAISLKHAFTSPKSDGGDATLIRPSNWNAEHDLTMATARMLGRTTSGAGAAEELTANTVRDFLDLNTTDSPTFVNLALDGYVDFTEIAEPGTPSALHKRVWAESNNGFAVLHWKDSDSLAHEFSRDLVHVVRNTTGVEIGIGTVVYISGSTGFVPNVALARANSPTTMPAYGLVTGTIAHNAYGQIMTAGDIQGLNTSGFSAGDVLYVSAATPGALTATIPSGTDIILRVGIVIRSHASQGVIGITIGANRDPAAVQTLSNKTLVSPIITGLADYADDAAAASGGVVVGGLYRTASVLKIRVS